MSDHAVLTRAETPFRWNVDRKVLWLACAAVVGLTLWFIPVMNGLTVTGQHALAVVIFTVLLSVSGAAPTSVVALMSGMGKDHPYVRHLAIMINMLANLTGTLVSTGFVMNPALGPLGGFAVNYTSWLQWFFVPALVYTLVCFFVIYFLFRPPPGA